MFHEGRERVERTAYVQNIGLNKSSQGAYTIKQFTKLGPPGAAWRGGKSRVPGGGLHIFCIRRYLAWIRTLDDDMMFVSRDVNQAGVV